MEAAMFGIAVAVAIAAIVWAAQWGSVRRAQIDASLKRDMLARGLSVEEMARLLRAAPSPTAPQQAGRPSETAIALAAAVESMVAAGKDADEVARFLDVVLSRRGGHPAKEPGTDAWARAHRPPIRSMATRSAWIRPGASREARGTGRGDFAGSGRGRVDCARPLG